MHFYRLGALLLALCLLLAAPALSCADQKPAYPPLPALSDPIDLALQRCATIYQKDPRFVDLNYFGHAFPMTGCGPSSLANLIITAFGVEDADTAAAIVNEMMGVMCKGGRYERGAVEMSRLPNLLNPQRIRDSAEKRPGLAASVGQYPGTIDVKTGSLTLERVAAALDAHRGKAHMLTGKLGVGGDDGWLQAVQIASLLVEAGLPDAAIVVSFLGAGTANVSGPMRTSGSGHYVGLYLHAGTFLDTGRVYLLDSLPRAIHGEEYAPELAYRLCYPFVNEAPDSAFNRSIAASRISPVVVRTDLSPAAQAELDAARAQSYAGEDERREAVNAKLAELLRPYILYGGGTALVKLPGQE